MRNSQQFLLENEENILSIPDLAVRLSQLEDSVYGPPPSDVDPPLPTEVDRPQVVFEGDEMVTFNIVDPSPATASAEDFNAKDWNELFGEIDPDPLLDESRG